MAVAKDLSLITLEEHFTSQAATKRYGSTEALFGPAIASKLTSLASTRLEDMDAGGVSKQILSHTPFPEAPSPELCKEINDELYTATQKSPDRLAGFASLPMDRPREAADELERAVRDLKFVGALVDTHTDGIWYDGPEYDAVWAKASKLDVPIYIHPCFASEEMLKINYRGNYDENVAKSLGAFVFGWHTETGLHFLRLFAAGVFDRFPKLKICLGHMGECVPYMFQRQEQSTGRWKHLQRPLREVWRTNIWTTTSGMFDVNPLKCLLAISPLDHVMISIDYPFSSTDKGRTFLELIEKEDILTGGDLEAFAHGNAAKLFGF